MIRVIVSISVFISTFAIGYNLAPRVPDAEPIEAAEFRQPVEVTPIPSTVSNETRDDDISPENKGLDELVYPNFSVKLVDIFHHGNAYRESEVIARNGERWLGLFEENGVFSLQYMKARVKFDPEYEGYGDEDYVRLKTSGSGSPIFILKNAKSLNAGRIETFYLRPSWEEMQRRNLPIKPLAIGYNEHLYAGVSSYRLSVVPGTLKDGTKLSVLVLSQGFESQIVTFNHYFGSGDNIGNLLWAGDLDGDKKLDLYIDNWSYEKGGFRSELYLSSEAEEGKLVKLVADFGTAGC